MSASAVGQEEGARVVICSGKVVGKGKQDGGTTMPGPHQPVLTLDTTICSFLHSPAEQAPKSFIQ